MITLITWYFLFLSIVMGVMIILSIIRDVFNLPFLNSDTSYLLQTSIFVLSLLLYYFTKQI